MRQKEVPGLVTCTLITYGMEYTFVCVFVSQRGSQHYKVFEEMHILSGWISRLGSVYV